MLKLLILLGLTVFIFIQTMPAYCGSRSESLTVSAFLPFHAMDSGNITLPSNNALQIVQTQTVVRGNKNVTLISTVVP